jgi:glycerol-3-phosphate dehydrogenase
MGLELIPKGSYSRDAFFIVHRKLSETHALAINARTRDPDAILSRQTRHLFLVPWRGYTLVGVWHVVHQSSPDDFTVTEDDLRKFIDEVNEAYPAFGLTLDDVSMWHAGLVLFGDNKAGSVHLSYGKRSRIVDHQKEHGIEGLVTLVGVRFTTARREASKAIDLIFRKLGKAFRKCVTDVTPIHGGQIERFEEFLNQVIERRPPALGSEVMRNLAHNHGSEYGGVLKYLHENPMWAETLGRSSVIKAEVLHAVRMEMAQKLGDVVLRRTDLGTRGFPGDDALRICADLMAAELGWNESRVRLELEEVASAFPRHTYPMHTNAGSIRHAEVL